MSIASIADLDAAWLQSIAFYKGDYNSTTNANSEWADPIYGSGDPGAVTAVANTTTGVVPTMSGDAGYPQFKVINKAYLTNVSGFCWCSSAAGSGLAYSPGRFLIYDRLFEAGPFVEGQPTYTLSSQPSFSSRLPGGSYVGLLCLVQIGGTGASSSPTITVTYTNESNVAGRSGSIVLSSNQATAISYTKLLPLQPGDKGVKKIESVTVAAGTNGVHSVNVVVARVLCSGVLGEPFWYQQGGRLGLDQLGMPEVYSDSALCVLRPLNATLNTSFCGHMSILFQVATK